jgi:ABC-2 type transport system permease protein
MMDEKTIVKASLPVMGGIGAALWAEFRKAWHSKTLWISALVFSVITLVCGLFIYILKDPEQARRLGLLGAKAQMFGGSADWASLFSLNLVIMSAGGLVLFGFIFVWIFGREFSDRTVYDMLALPTSRVIIVLAKVITAAYWSVALILLVFVLTLIIGGILNIPGVSASLILTSFVKLMVTGLLAIILCLPFALVASSTRGYLPGAGCLFGVLALGQVFDTLGYAQYFPWTVPALYSGAVAGLTGATPEPVGAVSYIIVALVSIIGLVATGAWWQYADQN